MQIEGPLGRILLPIPAFLIVMEASQYWFGPLPDGSTSASPEYALGLWGSVAFLIVTMWVLEKGNLKNPDDQPDEDEGENEVVPVRTTE